ncbi:branched-chain amino acid ABC transporter substrate-binding protein [Neisseria sp. Ec49-e6-T10]|uniref:branched-chain amino acid ABC transporter substrate-binding protein n=1 Tax=Neisseria sp. Ec49-e6-T10 TaxID=3140744 RepID=UPI003EBE7AEE
MKKLALVLLTSLALSACNNKDSASPSSAGTPTDGSAVTVEIGFSAPLTGPQSHYGQEYKNGVEMAIEEANAEGIKLNGSPVTFKLVPEDDMADPKTATQVAERLVDKGVAGVIGHFNSGSAIPASQIYNDASIPNISMCTSPKYTELGYANNFRSLTSDKQSGSLLGKYVIEKLGAKKIAIIDDRTAYGQGLADEFEKAVKDAPGVTILARQFTTDKATDFQSILTAIKNGEPDVVFYGGADPQSGPMAKQMKRLGIKAPLVSGEMTKTPTFIDIAGQDAEGTIASLAGLPLDQMPHGKEYADKYKTKYNTEVATYSPYGYDATKAMIQAMKEANSADPKVYLPKLKAIHVKGVTSEDWSYDDKGDLNNASLTIYKVENGKWAVVEVIK